MPGYTRRIEMSNEQQTQNEPVTESPVAEGGDAADDNDFPLGQACDLSGEGTCEACQ